MSRLTGPLAAGVALSFVLLFTRWNGSQRVTLDLGLWTFYRVPLAWVAVGSLLLGMGIMLLAGLHADLRVRRFLRDRMAREQDASDGIPWVDRRQQDLFLPAEPLPDIDLEANPEPPRESPPP